MGKTKAPYEVEYPAGTFVITADRATLERFLVEWQYHNKLQAEQLLFADQRARVSSVSFYHGGDETQNGPTEPVTGAWQRVLKQQCSVRDAFILP
jgi:hypothetical protein